ncbi:MAG TPA: hypothetical protein PKE26_08490 [Kiritimatiellia bacterium]|nr:hypothetical protein [Kiritimatiellia bacterium]HMO99132.1 hypothetical protein [Kiritimatiellia bacterium]HMP95690.1 hypothetical protein [Kiritimatiellia bacterium]
MIIEIPKVPPEGATYTAELPPEILELENDKFAHADGPVRCDFFIYPVSHELIVKGTVEAPVRLLCGRCGGFFSTIIQVSSFLRAYPISEGMEKLDISEDIREDVVIEIPSYPRCAWDGAGTCPFSGVNLDELTLNETPPPDNPWGALDRLGRMDDAT